MAKREFIRPADPPLSTEAPITSSTFATELNAHIVDLLVPTGVVDGANKVFALPSAPNPAGSLMLFKTGLLQKQGAGADYTLAGITITFAVAPLAGDKLLATYRI